MTKLFLVYPLGLLLFLVNAAALAVECPRCGQELGYREVVTYRCRMVPDTKEVKKTVYTCKEVPFCEHALPPFLHGDCCPKCQACPRYKRVLVKKEIVAKNECVTKCEVEEVVRQVPVPCCHCGAPCPTTVTSDSACGDVVPHDGVPTEAVPTEAVPTEPTPATAR